MLAIIIQFPAGGRYHATAWGTHANEGVPEWPPSPWRLLRALASTARWKGGGRTCDAPAELRQLLNLLASAPPPRFVLPPAAAAHTRHYMPVGDDSTTKVFDTFVQPDSGEPVTIVWDVNLDPSTREYLATLLGRLNYFGRAESLCEASLLPESAAVPSGFNAYPAVPGEPLLPEEQTVRLLAPLHPVDYAAWRDARFPPASRKLSAKERKALPPDDLFEALHQDTEAWRDAGWSQPPGSRWIEYRRPSSPFNLAALPRRSENPPASGNAPTVARFAIQSPVRESITRALSLGERLHRAFCSRSDAASAFSGQRNGEPLEGHQHALYLPECDHRGLLTHVTVVAGMGFDSASVEALRTLRTIRSEHGSGHKLVLLGLGTMQDFRDIEALRPSAEWRSLTPFIPVRHVQRSRTGKPRVDPASGLVRGSAWHDLLRLLRENGLPAPIEVQEIDTPCLEGRRISWANYQRTRHHGKGVSTVSHRGYGYRLRFPVPISGPLALGYGAHFGLGVFVPVIAPSTPAISPSPIS